MFLTKLGTRKSLYRSSFYVNISAKDVMVIDNGQYSVYVISLKVYELLRKTIQYIDEPESKVDQNRTIKTTQHVKPFQLQFSITFQSSSKLSV